MNKKTQEVKMLKGCRAGKAKYQQMLYELYYGKMLSVCLRYARSREEAKDVLHEGYMKVFAGIGNYKGDGSLEGWIRRIMINTAINHYHKNKKLKDTFSIEDEYEEATEQDYLTDEDVIQQMAYDDLLKIIRTLPPAYQTVFSLYAIEGYNHREIAEMLHISEGTSKSNLAKARKKLQKQVQELLSQKVYFQNV